MISQPRTEAPLTWDIQLRNERACERFEDVWRGGSHPRIGDYLVETHEPGRSALLRDLLCLELAYRLEAGERPRWAEYRARFREHAAMIDAVFGLPALPAPDDDLPLIVSGHRGRPDGYESRAMSDPTTTSLPELPASSPRNGVEPSSGDLRRRIAEAITRFDTAWRAGDTPRIEDYLDATIPQSHRVVMLGELLRRERDYRRDRGERPEATEYLERFPEHALVARVAFGGVRVGDHELIAPIGAGGMGIVYRARRLGQRKVVALKMIRPDCLASPLAVDRFLLESRIAAQLDHEHIVPVYEAGRAGDQPFFTMRYLPGRNLAEVIDGKPLDNRRAARYLEQVARAVAYAHSREILHRDLKPRNILIDLFDWSCVADFGLAKILGHEQGLSRPHERPGTAPYMAPEQVLTPWLVDFASDIYSLGATLYEALTGHPPFRGSDPAEIRCRIVTDIPTPPRSLNPMVHRDLETICMKCLEKDPRRRYTTAAELADDLKRYRGGRPIKATRIGPLGRTIRCAQRHPIVATAIAASLAQCMTLTAMVLMQRDNTKLRERIYDLANLTKRDAVASSTSLPNR